MRKISYNLNMPLNENYKNNRPAIGVSDFVEIMDGKRFYCDKTLLVKELLDNDAKVTLFTRPRRFGKTLNMRMLKTFFEKPLDGKDTSHYFRNLKIWQAGERYRAEHGKRPVIYLTLKDVKPEKYEYAFDKIKMAVFDDLSRHPEIFESVKFNALQKNIAQNLLNNLNDYGILSGSLRTLSQLLYIHHGEKPVILIDEYDVPIQAGYESGYYDQIIKFMRDFLSAAFKDNDNLFMGVLTGVSRVSKESIFSGLNNLWVDTIFEDRFSDCFGFTQNEVEEMFRFFGIDEKIPEAKDCYDGYIFRNKHIYNPWSLINYLARDCSPSDYWVNVAENGLAGDAIRNLNESDRQNLTELMLGESPRVNVSAYLAYTDLNGSIENAYGLLAQTGYLTAVDAVQNGRTYLCRLKIPNREVFSAYSEEVIKRILSRPAARQANEIAGDILFADAENLQKHLSAFLLETCSSFDLTEEKDYQNILIGLLASLRIGYNIKANREAGHGRADIIIKPRMNHDKYRNLPGIVLELMHYSATETEKDNPEMLMAELEKQAKEALKQIDTKNYISDLMSDGCKSVIKLGVAASGKHVCVKINSGD